MREGEGEGWRLMRNSNMENLACCSQAHASMHETKNGVRVRLVCCCWAYARNSSSSLLLRRPFDGGKNIICLNAIMSIKRATLCSVPCSFPPVCHHTTPCRNTQRRWSDRPTPFHAMQCNAMASRNNQNAESQRMPVVTTHNSQPPAPSPSPRQSSPHGPSPQTSQSRTLSSAPQTLPSRAPSYAKCSSQSRSSRTRR